MRPKPTERTTAGIVMASELTANGIIPCEPSAPPPVKRTSRKFARVNDGLVNAVKLKIADKPNNSTWPAFYAVSILTGIGFTMSLFVGNLAFANDMQYIDGVKIGVLAGSLLSTIFGYVLLLLFSKK